MSYQPKKGEQFYMVNSRGEVRHTENNGSDNARKRIAYGNCFKTDKEAEQYRKYVCDLGKYGYYNNMPKPGVIAKILTWLVYLLLTLIVIAACCLVIDFIFWIFNINVTVFGIKL